MLLPNLKKSLFLFCAGSMLVFTSCNGGESEVIDSEEPIENEESNEVNSNFSDDQDAEENAAFDFESEVSQDAPVNVDAKTGEATVKLNPAHGQPGHDCAIPVGQPLPSSVGVNVPNVNNTAAPKTVKLNPPHGQPGHDCAVPVGDPLN